MAGAVAPRIGVNADVSSSVCMLRELYPLRLYPSACLRARMQDAARRSDAAAVANARNTDGGQPWTPTVAHRSAASGVAGVATDAEEVAQLRALQAALAARDEQLALLSQRV